MKPDCVRISPNVALPTRGNRTRRLHGVGEVQHFDLDLTAHAAAQADLLGGREVPVVAVRRAHVRQGARQRAERVGRRRDEAPHRSARCRCRTSAGDAAAAGRRRDALVAACRRCRPSPVPGLAYCTRVKRFVVLVWFRICTGKPLSMPMIDEMVQSPRIAAPNAALQPALAFTERQFDDRRDGDLVRHVEQADRVFSIAPSRL